MIWIEPVWVWSDAAIPGHACRCVMGRRLPRNLEKAARGLHLSVRALSEQLGKIRVAAASRGGVPGNGGRPARVLEEMGMPATRLESRLRLLE